MKRSVRSSPLLTTPNVKSVLAERACWHRVRPSSPASTGKETSEERYRRQIAANDFEIHFDPVGRGALGEVLSDGAEMQFPADLGGKLFQHRDVALLTHEALQALPQRCGKFRGRQLIDFDTRDGDAFDYIPLIDVGLGSFAQELPDRRTRGCISGA